MKYLIFFLFIPMTFANSPRQCEGLAKTLNNYETSLQNKAYSKCNEVKIETLLPGAPLAIPGFLEEEMPRTSLSRKCSTLSSLEAEIQNLKVQQSILDGFEKLKTSIQTSKDNTANRDAAVAKRNGKTFVDRLSAAQSLEILLATRVKHREGNRTQTQDNIDKPILEVISARGPVTKEALKNLVRDLCANEDRTEQDACNPANFNPTDPAIEDVVNLINANEKIDEAQLEMFRSSLKIERKIANSDGKKDYSFQQMQTEMKDAFEKLESKDPMSKAHLRAIKGLSDFQSNPNFDIAEGLMTASVQKDVKLASNKFMLHMRDGLSRQEYETRHKLSVAWETHKDKFPTKSQDMVTRCDNAKNDFFAAMECHRLISESLITVTSQTARSDLGRQMSAINDNILYHTQLARDLKSCEDQYKLNGEITPTCISQIPQSQANVGEKILQLNALKEEIGKENLEMMKLRNFALFKWEKNKCGNSQDATMDLCAVENSTLSKETKLTVSNTLKIAILFAPEAKAEEEGRALCENEAIAKKHSVCSDDYVSDVTPPVVLNEGANGPTDAPDGGHAEAAVRDAWIGAGASLLKNAINHVASRQFSPNLPNPYPYNFGPYNGGTPPMGIADTIMFNARFQGAYGFYMPTPGYQPYTAFGASSSMTPYRPLGGGGGLFR